MKNIIIRMVHWGWVSIVNYQLRVSEQVLIFSDKNILMDQYISPTF
jgi:hypothetical protein